MTKTYDPLAKTKATSFTVVPLSPELDRKWTETRIRFIHSAPAFSHILYTMMAPGTDKQLALFTRDVPIAATDGVNHFDLIALFEHRVCVLAARDDVQIQLNRHPTARQFPKRQKACDGLAVRQFTRFTVQLNAHARRCLHF